MIRVFVALPIPAAIAARLAALVPAELGGLKRVAPELMHVTLAFIGWLPEERVEAVGEAVADAASASSAFDIPLVEVGRFPGPGRPRVLWVGPTADAVARIERLGGLVRDELTRRSVGFDPKPLVSHVTLARVREEATAEQARAVAEAMASARVPEGLALVADAVHVMRSVLGRQGPRYSSLARVALGKGDG